MTHSHGMDRPNRAFAIGVVLNLVFVAIEAGYGIVAGSLALVADAVHNLGDVVSLLLAWGASVLATRAATERRTYGFRKATVMAALGGAILLLVALGGLAWEALGRLLDPRPVAGVTVIVVAAVGVVINTATALLFFKGQKHDLNVRSAFLHMAADAGVSLGVVVSGLLIVRNGWPWIDAVTSLLIVAVILVSSWGLLRDSMDYAMDAVPADIDLPTLRDYLLGLDRVCRIHDLHVWPLSTTETALTVHLVVTDGQLDNRFLSDLQQQLHDRFRIAHATIQVESGMEQGACLLDDPDCR